MSSEYKPLLTFVETHLPTSFNLVKDDDPVNRKVKTMLSKNKQFFYIGDMLELKILYVSSSFKDVLGYDSSDFNPAMHLAMTHPDDMQRHSVARSKMIRLCSDLYQSEKNMKYYIPISGFNMQMATI